MQPVDRFSGIDNLQSALRDQFMLHGDREAAAALAAVATLWQHTSGEVILSQSAADNDLYFILSGEVSVFVHGQQAARRHAGQHVAEMALLDSSAQRSATISARGTLVVAVIAQEAFTEIANRYPNLWRRIAVALGSRLR